MSWLFTANNLVSLLHKQISSHGDNPFRDITTVLIAGKGMTMVPFGILNLLHTVTNKIAMTMLMDTGISAAAGTTVMYSIGQRDGIRAYVRGHNIVRRILDPRFDKTLTGSRRIEPLPDAAHMARSISSRRILLNNVVVNTDIHIGTARPTSKTDMDMLVTMVPWYTTFAVPFGNGNKRLALFAKHLRPYAFISTPSTGSIKGKPLPRAPAALDHEPVDVLKWGLIGPLFGGRPVNDMVKDLEVPLLLPPRWNPDILDLGHGKPQAFFHEAVPNFKGDGRSHAEHGSRQVLTEGYASTQVGIETRNKVAEAETSQPNDR